MRLFQKKETIVQNIAFLAIMAAINIVLLLLANILPYLLLFLTLILPFVSLLVTVFCERKYYLIYFIVTIGLSFLVSFNAITNIFFYIIPGLLSGFIFGYCIESEIPSHYSILYSAFVYVVCSYLSLIICNFLLDGAIEEIYFTLLNLDTYAWKEFVIAPFIFAISIIQSSLSYLIIQREIRKLGIQEKEIDYNYDLVYLFVFILLSILSVIIKPEVYLMFIGFALYEFFHVEKNVFSKSRKLFVITLFVILLGSIFGIGIFFKMVPTYAFMSLLLIPLFINGIIVLINNCFTKQKK